MSEALKNKFKFEIIKNNQKKCHICDEFKNFDKFGKSKSNKRCLDCQRSYRKKYRSTEFAKRKENEYSQRAHFKKEYGITIEQYQEMLVNQKGVCAICFQPEKSISYKTNKPMQLAVDHCHINKKVRSLLCNLCNRGIGSFKENVCILQKAVDYLIFHKK